MEEVKRHIAEWLSFCQKAYTVATCKVYTSVFRQLLKHIAQNGQQLSTSVWKAFWILNFKAAAGDVHLILI